MRIVVGTYNVHKCKGLDGLTRPGRIAEILAGNVADIWAIQEVLLSQAEMVAETLKGYSLTFGEARTHNGEPYGNATLVRMPLSGSSEREDVSVGGREPRMVLRTDLRQAGAPIVQFRNVHLGTSYPERKVQAGKLVSWAIASDAPSILAGDFNDWSGGSSIRVLDRAFEHLRKARMSRSYPGLLPLLHLDQIYFRGVSLLSARVLRTRLTMVASDHVPIMAHFLVPQLAVDLRVRHPSN